MKCLLIAIAWLSSLSFTSALVHFKQMDKGKNGCKINGTEVAVGEVVQDPNTCGVIECQSTDGDVLIHYCQIPVTFAECPDSAVITTIDFPQCCWTCASWGKCAGNGTGNTGNNTGNTDNNNGGGGTGGGDTGGGGTGGGGTGGGGTGGGDTEKGDTGGGRTGGGGSVGPARTKPHKIFSSKPNKAVKPSKGEELDNIKIGHGKVLFPHIRTIENPSEDLGRGGTGGGDTGGGATRVDDTGVDVTGEGGTGGGGTGGGAPGVDVTEEGNTGITPTKPHTTFSSKLNKTVEPSEGEELDNMKIGHGTRIFPQVRTIENPSEELGGNGTEAAEVGTKPKISDQMFPSKLDKPVEPSERKNFDSNKIGYGTPILPQEPEIKSPSEDLGTNP